MPGPVSDSYDPEFGTGENARLVQEAVSRARNKISAAIGSETLLPILSVVTGKHGKRTPVSLSESELRIIRFGLNRALESL